MAITFSRTRDFLFVAVVGFFFRSCRCYLPTLAGNEKKKKKEMSERTENELNVFSLKLCVSYENKPICHRSTYTCSRAHARAHTETQWTNVRWYYWRRQRQRESQDHFISFLCSTRWWIDFYIQGAFFFLFYVYHCSAFCTAWFIFLVVFILTDDYAPAPRLNAENFAFSLIVSTRGNPSIHFCCIRNWFSILDITARTNKHRYHTEKIIKIARSLLQKRWCMFSIEIDKLYFMHIRKRLQEHTTKCQFSLSLPVVNAFLFFLPFAIFDYVHLKPHIKIHPSSLHFVVVTIAQSMFLCVLPNSFTSNTEAYRYKSRWNVEWYS